MKQIGKYIRLLCIQHQKHINDISLYMEHRCRKLHKFKNNVTITSV